MDNMPPDLTKNFDEDEDYDDDSEKKEEDHSIEVYD